MLCADDYAMSEGVSRGIVELAAEGRISATGAMSVAQGWRELAAELRPFAGRIGLGLHLTLTGLGPLGPMPAFAPGGRFPALGAVVSAALRRRLPLAEIGAEIERQLDAFADALDRVPDFVDGHQHVHALPGIRGLLLGALARRGWTPWLRDPSDGAMGLLRRGGPVPKALVVATLATGFAARARRAGHVTNRGFAGYSDFRPGSDLRADFGAYLAAPGPGHLVMCHPGRVAAGDTLDGVVESRERERAFLASDLWPALLAERRMVLVPAPTEPARSSG